MSAYEMKSTSAYSSNTSSMRSERRLNWVLLVGCVFTIAVLVLFAVAIGTDYWLSNAYNGRHSGLWKYCIQLACQDYDVTIFLTIVRALCFVGLGLSLLALLLNILGLCNIAPKCNAAWGGVLLFFAFLSAGAVVGVYVWAFVITVTLSGTVIGPSYISLIGWSLIVFMVGTGLAFVAAILSCVGACVQPREYSGGLIIS